MLLSALSPLFLRSALRDFKAFEKVGDDVANLMEGQCSQLAGSGYVAYSPSDYANLGGGLERRIWILLEMYREGVDKRRLDIFGAEDGAAGDYQHY